MLPAQVSGQMTADELRYCKETLGAPWHKIADALGLSLRSMYVYARGDLPLPRAACIALWHMVDRHTHGYDAFMFSDTVGEDAIVSV